MITVNGDQSPGIKELPPPTSVRLVLVPGAYGAWVGPPRLGPPDAVCRNVTLRMIKDPPVES
jgi:hypothetical protein